MKKTNLPTPMRTGSLQSAWALLAVLNPHHELRLTVTPTQHLLQATDTVTLSGTLTGTEKNSATPIKFTLHDGLQPQITTPGVSLHWLSTSLQEELPLATYEVELPPGVSVFQIEYHGEINHPLKEATGEADRGISETPGLISEEGTSLFGQTHWYPQFEKENLVRFNVTVSGPKDWTFVSQGARTQEKTAGEIKTTRWESPELQPEIHLNGARFTEYDAASESTELMAFLRAPDSALAQKYLQATQNYLKMYSSLLGPYPYRKFALIENFWDTGYGMPSFTLIGTQILHLPFIINSSYPHEILHDWWGNSVFVDDSTGNWCEGLTVYLADHLLQEQLSLGSTYRREALQKFTNFVNEKNDFPLTQFRARFDEASSAIGYDKGFMFLHMQRLRMGDQSFTEALRRFYRENRFKVTSYADLQAAFEAEAPHLQFNGEFNQWVKQTGAPRLRVSEVKTVPTPQGYRLNATLEQTQTENPYRLQIPLAIHLEGQNQALQLTAEMSPQSPLSSQGGRVLHYSVELPGRPFLLEVDPEFDVFRRLGYDEIPASFSQAYGAEIALILIPSQAPLAQRASYQALADSIRKNQAGQVQIKTDSELSELPADRAVWILGAENLWAPKVQNELKDYGVTLNQTQVSAPEGVLPLVNHSFAFATPTPLHPEHSRTWIILDPHAPEPIFNTLGNKLPHYGKFSFAAFESPNVTVQWKGQWPLIHSLLSVPVEQPDGSTLPLKKLKLAPRGALIPALIPAVPSVESLLR